MSKSKQWFIERKEHTKQVHLKELKRREKLIRRQKKVLENHPERVEKGLYHVIPEDESEMPYLDSR